MYVGDHMYSDILRSKRTLGWRTVLIVPELDNEMEALQRAEDMQVRTLTPTPTPTPTLTLRNPNPNPNPNPYPNTNTNLNPPQPHTKP